MFWICSLVTIVVIIALSILRQKLEKKFRSLNGRKAEFGKNNLRNTYQSNVLHELRKQSGDTGEFISPEGKNMLPKTAMKYVYNSQGQTEYSFMKLYKLFEILKASTYPAVEAIRSRWPSGKLMNQSVEDSLHKQHADSGVQCSLSNGVSSLSNGVSSLSNGVSNLSNGVSNLSNGVSSLSSLSNGVSSLSSSLSNGLNPCIEDALHKQHEDEDFSYNHGKTSQFDFGDYGALCDTTAVSELFIPQTDGEIPLERDGICQDVIQNQTQCEPKHSPLIDFNKLYEQCVRKKKNSKAGKKAQRGRKKG